jgi:hypothetical protein
MLIEPDAGAGLGHDRRERSLADPALGAYARCTHAKRPARTTDVGSRLASMIRCVQCPCVTEGWKRVHKSTSRLRDGCSLRATIRLCSRVSLTNR